MQIAQIPTDEEKRLEAVHKLMLLDTEPEDRFDELTKEAVEKLKVSISTVTILDKDKEWFKSCIGTCFNGGERSVSFCGHALLAKDIFIVPDTLQDERFKDNPMVVNPPYIRFYAGMALCDHESNQPVGVFCVKDIQPRELSLEEIAIFMDLSNRAEKEINKK